MTPFVASVETTGEQLPRKMNLSGAAIERFVESEWGHGNFCSLYVVRVESKCFASVAVSSAASICSAAVQANSAFRTLEILDPIAEAYFIELAARRDRIQLTQRLKLIASMSSPSTPSRFLFHV